MAGDLLFNMVITAAAVLGKAVACDLAANFAR